MIEQEHVVVRGRRRMELASIIHQDYGADGIPVARSSKTNPARRSLTKTRVKESACVFAQPVAEQRWCLDKLR